MRGVIRVIDSISEWTGKTVRWVVLLMLVLIAFEVTERYVFNAPTIWAYDSVRFLLCAVCTLGWVYTHLRHGHVRIDLIYERLSPRGRAIIDVGGYLLFFFPFLIMLVYASAEGAWYSYSMGERSVSGFWYPPVYPVRIVMLLGVFLFTLQGVAQFTRDLYLLIRNRSYD